MIRRRLLLSLLPAGVLAACSTGGERARRDYVRPPEFSAICSQPRVTVARPMPPGSIYSRGPNLVQPLWLLFDAQATSVEFTEVASRTFKRSVLSFSPEFRGPLRELPRGGAFLRWRLSAVPRGDARCAAFDQWLARLRREPPRHWRDRSSTRWLSRAAYGDRCLVASLIAQEALRPGDVRQFSDGPVTPDEPRYIAGGTVEETFSGLLGPYRVSSDGVRVFERSDARPAADVRRVFLSHVSGPKSATFLDRCEPDDPGLLVRASPIFTRDRVSP